MRSGKFDSMIVAVALLALGAAFTAQADEPAADAAKGDVAVLYLGKLPITGKQQIIDTLVALKAALKEPFSTDPAKADTVVCRISRGTGTMQEYLDCATNRFLTARHEFSEEQMLSRQNGVPSGYAGEATQQNFDALIAAQPHHRLHVPINGGALQALLADLPDDAKVVADSN